MDELAPELSTAGNGTPVEAISRTAIHRPGTVSLWSGPMITT